MLSASEQKLLASALKRLEKLQRLECFDPISPSSRPTEKQQQVINDFGKIPQQWIRAGNQSGKSQTCARIVSWILTDSHPHWKRPKEWGEEPLLIIVAGRTGKQIEDSLLPKLKSYLEPDTFKEVRVGNIIQRLELDNGNRIIFQSLENPSLARERLQSYVAHLTWCDELPPTMDLVRELLVRTQARKGFSLFSFTPTIVSVEIQKYVDNLQMPEGRVYRFSMLDNPLYSDPERRQQLIDRYSYLTPEKREMVFEGGWLSADGQLYQFDAATMMEEPVGYSPQWRHIEAVDPAISSATGLTVWAENPQTGIWYCVKAKYIKDILVPTEIVAAVQKEVQGLNIVARTSDYAPWYVNTAASMKIKPFYSTIEKKNDNRKEELIKNLQEHLGSRIRISPKCSLLIDELQECRTNENGKIVSASRFHLLDSAQYFVDICPKKIEVEKYTSQEDYIYQQNEKRKVKLMLLEKKVAQKIQWRSKRWR